MSQSIPLIFISKQGTITSLEIELSIQDLLGCIAGAVARRAAN